MSTTDIFEMDCDDFTRQQLQKLLTPLMTDESDVRYVQRRNLDGDTATWIVLATLSSQVLPHVLNFLLTLRKNATVTRIKIGDIEIENPTAEQLELLRPKLAELNRESD